MIEIALASGKSIAIGVRGYKDENSWFASAWPGGYEVDASNGSSALEGLVNELKGAARREAIAVQVALAEKKALENL